MGFYYDVVAYAYDADIVCPNCLPVSPDNKEVYPIFDGEEGEYPEGLWCPSCHEEIFPDTRRYLLDDHILIVEACYKDEHNFTLFQKICMQVDIKISFFQEDRESIDIVLYAARPLDTNEIMNMIQEKCIEGAMGYLQWLEEVNYYGDTTPESVFAWLHTIHTSMQQFLGSDLYSKFIEE